MGDLGCSSDSACLHNTNASHTTNGCTPNGCGSCRETEQQSPQPQQATSARRVPSCMRCKEHSAVVAVRHRDPLCSTCAFDVTLAKVKHALRLKIGLAASDTIMLCLSGGHCSRALLQCLRETQSLDKSRPGRSKVAFDLLVAHVEEGAVSGASVEDSLAHKEAVWASTKDTVSRDQFICLHLEDAYLGDGPQEAAESSREARREKLRALIQAVPDTTGREDVVKALREALLMREARRRGVTHLARGDSSDRLAARAVALSAKGCGHALPASLHFIDARHGSSSPVWISPARELMAKDLAVAAYLQRLKTVASPPVPPFGRQESINALAERFVSGLQIGCPSAVHTILATASKLKRFSWNTLDGPADSDSDELCAVCAAPLETNFGDRRPKQMIDACCRSCKQQIFGLSASSSHQEPASESAAAFLSLAPPLLASHLAEAASPAAERKPMSKEQMREQLADFLIEDADD